MFKIVEEDRGRVEYRSTGCPLSSSGRLDKLLHRVTNTDIVIIKESGSHESFILETGVVEEDRRQRFRTVQLDVVCPTLIRPGEILYRTMKTDMFIIKGYGLHEGLILDVGRC